MGKLLKVLTYNIQVGIPMDGAHHYVLRSWRHFLPHQGRLSNLRDIGELLKEFDVVGLQEVDAGSMRSSFVNQVEYLGRHGDFLSWEAQVNRNLKAYAKYANGFLSRYPVHDYVSHRLPSRLPGRGVMTFCLGQAESPIVFAVAHLSLTPKAQEEQLAFIQALVSEYEHVVVMGDFNVELAGLQRMLPEPMRLICQGPEHKTYPSWKPVRQLDYILTSPGLKVLSCEVLNVPYSDHLPVAMTLELPEGVSF